jgi:hypothetical protein
MRICMSENLVMTEALWWNFTTWIWKLAIFSYWLKASLEGSQRNCSCIKMREGPLWITFLQRSLLNMLLIWSFSGSRLNNTLLRIRRVKWGCHCSYQWLTCLLFGSTITLSLLYQRKSLGYIRIAFCHSFLMMDSISLPVFRRFNWSLSFCASSFSYFIIWANTFIWLFNNRSA